MKLTRKLVRIASELDSLGLSKLANEVDKMLDTVIEDESELSDEESDDYQVMNRQQVQHDREQMEENLVWDIVNGLKGEPDVSIKRIGNDLFAAGFVLVELTDDTRIFINEAKKYDYSLDFDHSNVNFDINIEKAGDEQTLSFKWPRNELQGESYQRHINEAVSKITELL